ncbi:MAG: 2-keto-4-pentenoate hydratase [Sandaracinaceae bacterium]
MQSSDEAIEEAARALWEARRVGAPIPPVAERLAPRDIEAAYAVQDRNTERSLAEGRRLVGRKTGLTSVAVQRQLGVDQPDYGMLFGDMAVGDGEPIAVGRLIQPRCEAEVALVLGDDLDAPHLTVADVLSAVDYCLAAIEVVDSRIESWRIGIVDTIADNASSGLFVLGTEPRDPGSFDPRLCGMVLERRGEPVSVGAGAACLGNPFTAATWLANTMVAVGRPLLAGDLVLTGALGPLVDAAPGDVMEARIHGLGSVRVRFAREA